jgi:hypothetical protein
MVGSLSDIGKAVAAYRAEVEDYLTSHQKQLILISMLGL